MRIGFRNWVNLTAGQNTQTSVDSLSALKKDASESRIRRTEKPQSKPSVVVLFCSQTTSMFNKDDDGAALVPF
jgi:hypothetical protein